MTEATTPPVGITTPAPVDLSSSQTSETGNPAPKAPLASAPKPEPTDAEKAAIVIAAKEAEDKAKAAALEADDKPLDTTTFGDTGSEHGNAVLTMLQNSGVTPEDAKALMYDAILAGDATKIDRTALEAKVGKVKAGLIITGAKAFVQEQQEAANKIVSTLHDTVGGKGNWDTITKWAKAGGVAEDDRAELVDMINAGGRKAIAAANELKALYEKAPDNSSLNKEEVLTKGGDTGGIQKHPPMSAGEYVKALGEANKAHFGNVPDSVRQALLSARQAGKKLGK